MNIDRTLAVVLPPLAALAAAYLQTQSGAADVYNSEVHCGKVIAAIYGEMKPPGGE